MEIAALESIRRLLEEHGVAFSELKHEPTPTSEDSARVRGEPLRIGAKAIVMKIDDSFGLFVLSADRKLDSKAIKRHFGARSCRFATTEELLEIAGLVPGSVPPFGRPVLDLDLYIDGSVLDNEKVAFNAGSLTHSIIMSRADYERCAGARKVFTFSR